MKKTSNLSFRSNRIWRINLIRSVLVNSEKDLWPLFLSLNVFKTFAYVILKSCLQEVHGKTRIKTKTDCKLFIFFQFNFIFSFETRFQYFCWNLKLLFEIHLLDYWCSHWFIVYILDTVLTVWCLPSISS